MRQSYTTPKGTELPILNLRGKEYLEVKYRLVWFREEHPDWSIESVLLKVEPTQALAQATVKDAGGRVIAMGHKFENVKGFPDFIEKCETGAIGRALALIGYGTQFCADELDEGERIVDSPTEPRKSTTPSLATQRDQAPRQKPKTEKPAMGSSREIPQMPANPGDYEVTLGKKYKGVKLKDIPTDELQNYVEWLEIEAAKKDKPLSAEGRFLKVAVGRYINSLTAKPATAEETKPAAIAPPAFDPDEPLPEPAVKPTSLTTPQRKKLFATMNDSGWTEKQLKEVMMTLWSIDSTSKLTQPRFNWMLKMLTKFKPDGYEAFCKRFTEDDMGAPS